MPGRLALTMAFLLCAASAQAEFISAPDVVVYTDPTLSPALQAVARLYRARTGVPVRVLSAPGPLLMELIARGTRDDVLATRSNWMDQAAERKLIQAETRQGAWRDPIVLAGKAVPALAAPPSAEELTRSLTGGKLGVIDPTQSGGADGPALVERLGWRATLAGEIDGPGVAFLLDRGDARLGLLERTAVVAQPGLSVVATLPDDLAPGATYAAAISHNILSRNTTGFMDFLKTAEATDALRQAGLDVQP